MKKQTKVTLGIILFLTWITLSCTGELHLAAVGVLALAASVFCLKGTEYVG